MAPRVLSPRLRQFGRPAFAQEWTPSSPIKLVVAYPAGGPVDSIARIVLNAEA